MNTPVVLILFNRADATERVMRAIATARPAKLFLVADGPRDGQPEDVAKCAAAREAAERLIDWECEVFRNYSNVNLGCGRRPATGITWVFEHVGEAIILEDDCVPHPTFFPFCAEMLRQYRDDERIVQVCGNLYHFGRPHGDASYFFSRHNICAGGWATWRRSWLHFDIKMPMWPRLRDTPWLRYVIGEARAAQHWHNLFEHTFKGEGSLDIWDYQWTFACWLQSGLSIVPNVGLLTNIGFRPDGTHTKRPDKWANLPMAEMPFPLRHPPCVVPDSSADFYFVEQVAGPRPPSFRQRWRRRLSHHLPTVIRQLFARRKPGPAT